MAKKPTAPTPPKKKKTVIDYLLAPVLAGAEGAKKAKNAYNTGKSKAKAKANKATTAVKNSTSIDEGMAIFNQLSGLNKKKKK